MVHEDTLVVQAVCPLYTPPAASRLETCAQTLLKATLLRSFEGIRDPFTLSELREKYTTLWNESWFGDKPKAIPPSGPYWDGPKMAARVARNLFNLISLHEVIQPEQPYLLTIDRYTIQGRYSLIRRKTNDLPYVLMAHSHAPLHKASPDLKSLARHAHVMRHHLYKNVGILHLPLLRGQIWKQKSVDEFLAEKYLKSMLSQIDSGAQYPVPGPHCLTCVDKSCLKVFPNGR